jgi:hypothetical protein
MLGANVEWQRRSVCAPQYLSAPTSIGPIDQLVRVFTVSHLAEHVLHDEPHVGWPFAAGAYHGNQYSP